MVEAKKYTDKEIRECMETFSYIPMKNLHFELEAAQENGKYVLCVDKNENSQIYFSYKATMNDFHKEVLKC
jgi:hypothetical protein